MSKDNWLSDYDSVVQLGDDIMERINERNRTLRNGGNPTKVSVGIRGMMNQYGKQLNNLKQALARASSSYHITDRELDRRQDMLGNLFSRQKQINMSFQQEGGTDASRGMLFHAGEGSGRVSGPEETAYTRGQTNDELRTQQQVMIEEQDRGLEALSGALSRQKQIGLAIGDEVEYQNEIIDDLGNRVDRTNERLVKTTKAVRKVHMKASDTGMCCIVVLLLIAIVVVAVVPK
ncbi:syntaxin-8-like [Sycon ciliatum]|uniref:syntaxin-8-like n=1 Tax=Sycon ciliatum TaxID=27933 RepID=UPI0020ADA281|eukprot:scpid59088/ scgid33306/ Syntaxin-8